MEREGESKELGPTSCGDLGATGGQLDVDNVAQGLLGVLGDAHGAETGAVVERDPLVLGRVALGCCRERGQLSSSCSQGCTLGELGGEEGRRDSLTMVRKRSAGRATG